jgi:hypothetical protein
MPDLMPVGPWGVEPVIGSIRGFRWWRLSGTWLASPWRGDVRWSPDGTFATCLGRRWLLRCSSDLATHERGVPARDCSCGFYAMLQAPTNGVDVPGSWPLNPSLSGGPMSLVFGTVRGSGRVLLGEHGWRAERADVDALYIPPSRIPSDPLETAAATYKVRVYDDLGELCEERGPEAWVMDLARAPRRAA